MSETTRASQNFPYTNEENALGRKFFVFQAGNTQEAHHVIVKKLSRVGQIEVTSAEVCDYILVFCPVVSRVGTDIAEALYDMPSGKPAVLVVMHHTFDHDRDPGESRRQVDHPNVRLTVDCLFYEGKLLDCNRNDIMWHEVQRFLRVPENKLSSFYKRNMHLQQSNQDIVDCLRKRWVVAVLGAAAVMVAIIIIIIIIVTVSHLI